MASQDTYDLRLAHCPEPSCGYRVSRRSLLAVDERCPKCHGYWLSEFLEDGHGRPPWIPGVPAGIWMDMA